MTAIEHSDDDVASIESDRQLTEHVCHHWRNTRACEIQKWLLGCAFGLGRAATDTPQVEELKFLSRLAGYRLKESSCGRACRRSSAEQRPCCGTEQFALNPA